MIRKRLKIKKKSSKKPYRLVSFRVSEEQLDAIRARARFFRITFSEFIRYAALNVRVKPEHVEDYEEPDEDW